MKFLVIGTGSIGLRHLSNLNRVNIETWVYSHRHHLGEISDRLAKERVLAELNPKNLAEFDAVIISNRTNQHIETALSVAPFVRGIYIEKPLSVSLEGVEDLAKICARGKNVVEMGFMLRSHPNLIAIKDYIDSHRLGKVIYARAAVGQYLPDWRPGSDYRKSVTALKKFGGGVIFELIHEIDLVRWLLGPVNDVNAMASKNLMLDTETEVVAQINLRLANEMQAQVHLDCVRRDYQRVLEIVGTKGTVTWDYSTGTVVLRNKSSVSTLHQVPEGFDRNDIFIAHMNAFVNRLKQGKEEATASLEDGIESLKIAIAAHLSNASRKNIDPFEVHKLCADGLIVG